MIDYTNHPLNKKYNLDTALTSVWEFYKKWFLSLFLIAFVFSLISTVLTGNIDIAGVYSATDPDEAMEIIRSVMGPYALILFLTFVFTLILQYYVLHKPLDEENNVFVIGINGIIKFFIPLLVLNIILGVVGVIAIMLGVLLLFVGAIFAIAYIFLIAAFLTPVLMVENQGIGDTISKTLKLAHKGFWQNLGWVVVFGILIMVISFFLGAIVMIPFGGSFIKSLTNPENATEVLNLTSKPSFIILNSLANAITMPLFPIFSLVLYFNAKNSNTGVDETTSENDNNDPVKIEDLYSKKHYESRKGKSDDTGTAPTIDDLMPKK